MKNVSLKVINLLITLLIGILLFYFFLPCINVHSLEFWIYLCFLLFIYGFLNSLSNLKRGRFLFLQTKLLWPFATGVSIIVLVVLVMLFNSPVFMAKKYYERINVNENAKFSEGIKEVDFNSLALLDKESSKRLGDRVMGQMSELVSQFDVSNLYTQINYKDKIVRVTPLEYSTMIKYFANRRDGVKGYIMVDSVTGEATLKKLKKGMKYVQSAMFFENVERYLRFKYPFDNFGTINFEIDNDGNPYWIMPVIKYASINARPDISHVIILNAVTGDAKKYKVADTPKWVDHVYMSSLILSQVNDWGSYGNGFFNTLFSQKGMKETTRGYNYLVMNDDVYLYTGITSVVSDESNLGFILTNLRTKETNFYSCPGAEEFSAMESAKGQVQQMGYSASFPLLINLGGKPTYLISLKDNAGLVKMYAFVLVSDYQKVVVTDAVLGIEAAANNYLTSIGMESTNAKKIVIKDIKIVNIDGTTYYYLVDVSNKKYRVSIKVNINRIPFLNIGDEIEITYNDKEVSEILTLKLQIK